MTSSPLYPLAKNNTCVCIGTSIAGGLNSYYECLMLIAGGRLKRYRNGGLNGQNSSYIAEHMWNAALNANPGIAIITPAYNGAGTFSSQLEGTKRIIDAVRKSGALCVVTTEPTTGGVNNLAYNASLKTYVAGLNDPGCIISDLAAVIFQSGGTGDYIGHVSTTATNTASSTGVAAVFTVANATGITVGMGMNEWQWVQAVSGNTITVSSSVGTIAANASPVAVDFWQYMQNSVHPGTVGSMAIAQQILIDMENAGFLRGYSQYTPLDNNDVANLITNGTFEGTVTSGLGQTWLSNISSSYLSVVTDALFRGKAQQISIPPGGTGGYLNSASVNMRPYRGRKIAFSFKMSASGIQQSGGYYSVSATTDIDLALYPLYSGASSNASYAPIFFQSADFEGQGMLWYGETVVPDNATTLNLSIQIYNITSTAPANFVMKIGEVACIDITDPLYTQIRRQKSIDKITTSKTLDASYESTLCDATSGAISVTLPTPSAAFRGKPYTIKKIDSSANAVTLVGTVDGATNPTLANQYACKVIECDASTWWTISQYLT